MVRDLTMLLGTSLRMDLVRLENLSTFAVAVIFAPVGAEDVTTVHRLWLGLALTFTTVLYMCSQAIFGVVLVFLKLHIKAEEGNR